MEHHFHNPIASTEVTPITPPAPEDIISDIGEAAHDVRRVEDAHTCTPECEHEDEDPLVVAKRAEAKIDALRDEFQEHSKKIERKAAIGNLILVGSGIITSFIMRILDFITSYSHR